MAQFWSGIPLKVAQFWIGINIDKRPLLRHLRAQFEIEWYGHHGVRHWARVRANGLMLAQQTQANPHVVELFAFFHDARRLNEYEDDDHGRRGAALAKKLKGRFFDATDFEMDLLTYACQYHTRGLTAGDVTVLTCWDADRLDLGRVGIRPNPSCLCTSAAKTEESLEAANTRALAWKRAFDSGRQLDA